MNSILRLGLALILATPTLSFALSAEDNYPRFCGSRTQLLSALKEAGEDVSKVTEATLREANKTRLPIFKVLQKGELGVQELSDKSNNPVRGAYAALFTCGMVLQLEKHIKAKGCTNLETNEVVYDNGGIEACRTFLQEAQK